MCACVHVNIVLVDCLFLVIHTRVRAKILSQWSWLLPMFYPAKGLTCRVFSHLDRSSMLWFVDCFETLRSSFEATHGLRNKTFFFRTHHGSKSNKAKCWMSRFKIHRRFTICSIIVHPKNTSKIFHLRIHIHFIHMDSTSTPSTLPFPLKSKKLSVLDGWHCVRETFRNFPSTPRSGGLTKVVPLVWANPIDGYRLGCPPSQ